MSVLSLNNADVHQVIAASHHAVANKALAPLVLAVAELSLNEGIRPEAALMRVMKQGAQKEGNGHA
ncbi:hypothetical protein [Vibrio jasicida]|uniref:hypothetical protein n=1 Tax=Vibrio jasicida TaxID=766224 RepID=UPI0005EF1B6B|nr:hypothetical protein [Vibrio jasicida]